MKIWTVPTQVRHSMNLSIHVPWLLCVFQYWGVVIAGSTPALYGEVQSPGYPNPYHPSLNESWDLVVPQGYTLNLTFRHIDIEPSHDCYYDTLMVMFGKRFLGRFCGHNYVSKDDPSDSYSVMSPGNSLCLVFKTDASTPGPHRYSGFLAFYQAVDIDECSAEDENGQACHHECQNTPGGFLCSCRNGYQLQPDNSSCLPVDCGFPVPKNGTLRVVSKIPKTLYQNEIQFGCESKYYRLEGDDVYRCEAQGYWRSLNGSRNLPKCVEVCGEPEIGFSDFGRILGGSEAKPGQIPWLVYVKDPVGAGSLISDRWVLTAAQAIEGQDRPVLYGGTVDVENIGSSNSAVILESEKVFIQPDSRTAPTRRKPSNFDNRIALVKLKYRAPLGPHLLPICLPERKDDGTLILNRLGYVSGWGRTENGTLSSKLLYVKIPVMDRDTCFKRKDGKPLVQTFSENMFCAGEMGKDSCHGDSGGPFFLREFQRGAGGQIERGPFRLYGVVSWGIVCEDRGYFTKVDNYLDWIRETIEKEERKTTLGL
nr:PREDICTED: complement C1s subcomponent-like [Lepisosteus oculatus]XP_015193363.1 PREDICTED: complement C1s subcomponent-like [Lepisosteus oculatus]